jgi:hypothetical protein
MDRTLPFELHVTVANAEIGLFVETCKQLGVKPLLIVAQYEAKEDTSLNDLQTSSIVKGDWSHVCNELTRIRQGFEKAGITVIREKVETSPSHPDVPRAEQRKAALMPLGCYFETHIPIVLQYTDDHVYRYDELLALAKRYGAHLSRNAFKYDAADKIFMITLRDYSMTYEAFEWLKYKLEDELFANDFQDNLNSGATIEFVVYDSNVSHDDQWLRKGAPSDLNTHP